MVFRIVSSCLMPVILAGIVLIISIGGCNLYSTGEWNNEDNYRWKEMGPSFHLFDHTGFEKRSSGETGISFQNTLTEEQIKGNRNLLNGSGVAAGDIDGDGLTDIYFARLDGPNKLYKNLGNWEFEDITAKAGLELNGQFSTGVSFADIDGDGDLDLLVTALGSTNKLFINDGKGRFEEKTGALESEVYGSMSAAFADIDRDGDLDLYIANYKEKSAKDLYPNQRGFSDIIKEDEQDGFYIPDHLKSHYEYEQRGDVMLWFEKGEDDLLYKNDGEGNFTKIPFDSGVFQDENGNPVTKHEGWGLHAKFFDINEDGYLDLYVCNDFETPDRIWINNTDGTFRELGSSAIRHLSLSSMSVDMSDINRDEEFDIFVVEMVSRDHRLRSRQLSTMIPLADTTGKIDNRPLYMGNTMFLKRGDNTFAEIADYSGVTASEWSWGTLFMDVDLDGFEDIVVATGNYFDTQDLDANSKIARKGQLGIINPREEMFEYPSLKTQNVAFRNSGDLRFQDHSTKWGFEEDDISHGLATADLDNDGDQDLIFNRLDSEAGVYENKSTNSRIRIKLLGDSLNTNAIGSSIEVSLGSVTQKKQVSGTGAYLSVSSYDYTFAASDDSSMSIRVVWPDQTVTVISDVRANRFYEITGNGHRPKDDGSPGNRRDEREQVYFEDVSSRLNHQHTDMFFDDFEIQPLLPRRLSQYGPGISFFDFNGDGADDLFIGTGRGGQMAYYENDGEGYFSKVTDKNLAFEAANDLSGMVGWRDTFGTHLAIGNYFYEDTTGQSNAFLKYINQNSGFVKESELSESSDKTAATGPLALADIDSDGDLDLFVGKYFARSRYPAPVSSYLYINNDGNFEKDEDQPELFRDVGMISGAVFSDLNQDGYPDLLLASQWGNIRLYMNNEGRFTEITDSAVFAGLTGAWNGITTGDFNNDGRLDVLASNHGLNDFYTADTENEKFLFYGDLTGDGVTEIIEAYRGKDMEEIVPTRKLRLLGAEIPSIGQKFWSHEQFSKSTLRDVIGADSSRLDTLKLSETRTMVFLNLEEGFVPAPLPEEVQFTPAFAANVADFNGDGNEDIFLSQNFFANRVQDRRLDAGRGMWLEGDGKGSFTVMPGSGSGIKIYGEQRSAAVSDINSDGRIDLLVTQNGGETKLFANKLAEPGLTVTLKGEEDNPGGIGSSIRFRYQNGFGPRREVKAGSGYWSQNSADILLGYNEFPEALEINWAGGKSDTVILSRKSDHIIVSYDGEVVYK